MQIWLRRTVVTALATMMLGGTVAVHALSGTHSEVLDAPQLTVSLDQAFALPGDTVLVTVTATNVTSEPISNAAVRLNGPEQGVTLSDPTLVRNELVWELGDLSTNESASVLVNAALDQTALMSSSLRIDASLTYDGGEIVGAAKAIVPKITVQSQSVTFDGPASRSGRTTVTGEMAITANTTVDSIEVVESLDPEEVDVAITPKTTHRVEDAKVQAGSATWSMNPNVGDTITIGYQATYPAKLNVGIFDLEVGTTVMVDDRTVFERTTVDEIRTPQIDASIRIQDLSPAAPIAPGDTVSGEIVLTNTGGAFGDLSVSVKIPEELGNVDGSGATFADGNLVWDTVQMPTVGNATTVSFLATVASTIREDSVFEIGATIALDGQPVDSAADQFTVDTNRAEGSDTDAWLLLIMAFVLASFFVVWILVVKTTDVPKNAANIATVLILLGTVLVMSFGLDLANETTLALVGSIAGYVLGRDRDMPKTDGVQLKTAEDQQSATATGRNVAPGGSPATAPG